MNDNLIDISEASRIFGTSIVTARKLIGDPVMSVKNKYNLPRYLYSESAVLKAAEARRTMRTDLAECRRCHCKFKKTEIIGGKCRQCKADICVLKFCGIAKLPCENADPALIACLRKAIDNAEAHNEK